MSDFTISINGAQKQVSAEFDMPVLWLLRDTLAMPGTKFGCGIGACGACTILLDGQPTRSCQLKVSDVGSASIKTIEGLAGPEADAVRQAWRELNVVQCGWCQSGQIVAATALLQANKTPKATDITDSLDGNLCRCGTYARIKAAVVRASEILKG